MLQALRERDAREVEPFEALIREYNAVLRNAKSASEQLATSERKNAELQDARDALTHEVKRLQDEGGQIVDTAKITLLEDKISELQEERGDLYCQQAAQSNKMLEMSAQVEEAQETVQRYKTQIDGLESTVNEKQTEITGLEGTLDDVNLQSSNWANQANTLSGNLDALRLEHEELKKLHEDLVERWVSKSEELSQQMNEVNKMRKQLSEDRRAFEVLSEVRKREGAAGAAEGEEGPSLTSMIDANFLMPNQLPTQVKHRIQVHEKECNNVAFNNNTGAQFATCSTDKTVKVWQTMGLSEGGETHTIRGHAQAALSVNFSADDSMIITTGADNSVRVFQTSTARQKHVLAGHKDKVFSARCFPDCRNIVSGSHDRTVKYWDLPHGKCAQTFLTTSMINDVAVPSDGMTIATAHYDGTVRFFDPRTKEELQKMQLHDNHVTTVCYSPDGSKLVTNSKDNTLKMIDVRMYGELCTMKSEQYRNPISNNRAAVSPNGKYVAAGGHNGCVVIWDLTTSKQVKKLYDSQGSTEQINSCSWSPNGQDLATSDRSGVVCIWSS